MKDTCGRSGENSSGSAGLQRSLANKLEASLDVNGSLEYSLTWKEWDMPSREPICALRASTRRTSGKDFGGWPTCSARDWKNGKSNQHGRNARPLNEVALLVGWATPVVNDATGSGYTYSRGNHDKKVLKLPGQVSGATLMSSTASTESKGALNPAHSRWLMGFPTEWDDFAPTATRSSYKSQQNP